MYFKRVTSWLIAVILVVMLILVALPVAPIAAQDGLSDDERALVDRVLVALLTVQDYQTYELANETAQINEWTGGIDGQVMYGEQVEIVVSSRETGVRMEDGTNIRREITVSVSVEEINPPTRFAFTLQADIRTVDGALYVKAAYLTPDPALPAVPDGWIEMASELSLASWPGLNILNLQGLMSEGTGDPLVQRFGLSLDDLQYLLTEVATSATLEMSTLEDGTPIDLISVTLGPDSLPVVLGEVTEGSVDQMIYEAVEDDPVVLTLGLDSDCKLVYMDYALLVDVVDLDLSAVPDMPDGLALSANGAILSTWQFSAINEPVEQVAAPDIEAVETAVTVPEVVELPWWNDRVFYEVFVRSFYDSDGDGIGDLRGVIEKLDYLNDGDPATTGDLGITGIWLMPVMQSPSYHGYDVTDYYTIEEDYGTNADFLELMEEAHKRGIVVIVDLVLNHTSSQHPWFEAARSGDPDYEDWYIWVDDPPDYRGPWGQNVWHRAGDRFFFGLFEPGMPDLNYENPDVATAMYQVTRFWLEDMGVDGFRLDAIRHLIEEGPVMQNTPPTLRWLVGFHNFVDSVNPDALTVGEIWDSSAAVVPYIGERVDLAFEFDLAGAFVWSANQGNNTPLVIKQREVLGLYPPGQYATFLTNHDQNRVRSQLAGDVETAKVAATLLLTGPGVPFVYYGEEIGMVGVKPDERIRTPMQWDSTQTTGGFTTADQPWETMAEGYRWFNVDRQADQPDSLLNHYRSLIHLRSAHPALLHGAMQVVDSTDARVYSFLRFTEDETLLVVVNLAEETVDDYALNLVAGPLSGGGSASLIFGEGLPTAPAINDNGGFADYVPLDSLPPQSSYVIQFE